MSAQLSRQLRKVHLSDPQHSSSGSNPTRCSKANQSASKEKVSGTMLTCRCLQVGPGPWYEGPSNREEKFASK